MSMTVSEFFGSKGLNKYSLDKDTLQKLYDKGILTEFPPDIDYVFFNRASPEQLLDFGIRLVFCDEENNASVRCVLLLTDYHMILYREEGESSHFAVIPLEKVSISISLEDNSHNHFFSYEVQDSQLLSSLGKGFVGGLVAGDVGCAVGAMMPAGTHTHTEAHFTEKRNYYMDIKIENIEIRMRIIHIYGDYRKLKKKELEAMCKDSSYKPQRRISICKRSGVQKNYKLMGYLLPEGCDVTTIYDLSDEGFIPLLQKYVNCLIDQARRIQSDDERVSRIEKKRRN